MVLLLNAAVLWGAALTHLWLDARVGFEENRGQARAGILFLVRGDSVSAYVTADSLVRSADQMGLRFTGASPAPVVRAIPVSVAVGDHESPGPVTVAVR